MFRKQPLLKKKKKPARCLPRSWTLPRFPRASTQSELCWQSQPAQSSQKTALGGWQGAARSLALHRQSLQESRACLLPPKPCRPQPGLRGGAPTPSSAEPHEVGSLDCPGTGLPPGHLPSSPSPTPPIPVSRRGTQSLSSGQGGLPALLSTELSLWISSDTTQKLIVLRGGEGQGAWGLGPWPGSHHGEL